MQLHNGGCAVMPWAVHLQALGSMITELKHLRAGNPSEALVLGNFQGLRKQLGR